MTKAEISFIRSLSSRKERYAAGVFVAEGEKLVKELLASSFTVRRVYLCGDGIQLPQQVTVPSERITSREMERISLLKTPSDILAVVEMPDYGSTETFLPEDWVLALDDVQDPGNMGTIIRLADWFGIRDIFCSKATVDCFNPKVVQATMGAIVRVRVHYVPLPKFLQRMLSEGIPVYGTFLEGENIYDAELPAKGILVMGNEGQGISTLVEQQTTRKLFIPSYPTNTETSESLNVAIATAVATAEIRRRLR